MTDEQIAAIAEAGARAFAQDIYGRAGFDHVMDDAGYVEREEPDDDNVYVEEIHPEWVKIARDIIEATLKAERT